MTWTLSGFLNPISGLQVQARRAPDRGNPSVTLVLTLNNKPDKSLPAESELINKDSDLQQIQTNYDYLTVNGHEIWITDFIVSLEIICLKQGGGDLSDLVASSLLQLFPLATWLRLRSQAEQFQPSV